MGTSTFWGGTSTTSFPMRYGKSPKNLLYQDNSASALRKKKKKNPRGYLYYNLREILTKTTQLSVAPVSGRAAPLCNMLCPRQERIFSTGKVVGPR